jgi:hypothetical protein
VVMAAGRIEGFEKPPTRTILAQERQPPETGKGQFMSMAWLVVALVLSSVVGTHIRTAVCSEHAFAAL